MVKCDHLISLIKMNLKIFIYSKFIMIVSFYINVSQFINKTRGLFFGGSVNYNYMCCLEWSMVFGFADISKYSKQLTAVRMWVGMHYLENMTFGLMHSERVDECDHIFPVVWLKRHQSNILKTAQLRQNPVCSRKNMNSHLLTAQKFTPGTVK